MSELKPCPFCPDGGDVRMLSYFCETEYVAYAHCRRCGAYGPRITESLPLKEVKAEAAEAWNARHERTCETCEQMGNPDSFISHLLNRKCPHYDATRHYCNVHSCEVCRRKVWANAD